MVLCVIKSAEEIKCVDFYHEAKKLYLCSEIYAAKIFSLLSIISYYAAHPIRRVLYLYD